MSGQPQFLSEKDIKVQNQWKNMRNQQHKVPTCVIRMQGKLKPIYYVQKVVTDNLLILKKLLESNERMDLKEELGELTTLIEHALPEIQSLAEDSRKSYSHNCSKIEEYIKLLDQLMIKLEDKNFTRHDIVQLIHQFKQLKDQTKVQFPQKFQDPDNQMQL